MHSNFSRKAITFIFCFLLLTANFSIFAQVRKTSAPNKTSVANPQKTADKKCNGGWSGTITYSKTVNQSERNKTPTGYQSSTSSYQATAEVTVSEDGSARASVKVKISGNIEDVKEGSECCTISLAGCSKNGSFKYLDVVKTETNAQATSSVKGVNIAGESFSTNISLPEAVGKTVRTFETIRQRSCDSLNKNSSHQQEAEASISVGPIQISADVDPNNPNVIRGTKTVGDVTISYNLTRCAKPDIKLSDLALEHHVFPDAQAWHAIGSETVDGNLVRIKAKVRNDGNAPGYATVKFTETSEKIELPGTVSVSLQPGEEREIESEWDTTGFSWSNDGKPKSNRQIKAEVEDDSLTEDVKVYPKPVILVHGLWSNAAAWSDYQSYLNEAHSFAWKAFPVGAMPGIAKMSTGEKAGNWEPTNSIFQNAQELGKQIKFVRKEMNAWHVDIVAHSMGGLISRFYIHNFMQTVFDGKPEAEHLVMLGTPNMGSPCADIMYGTYENFDKPVEALRELKPSVVAEFNRKTYDRKKVKFSILAGYAVPLTCYEPQIGDGVVGLSSALYNIADRGYSATHHLALTDDANFKKFVLPRLAIGPKGDSSPQSASLFNIGNENFAFGKTQDSAKNDRYGFAKYFQKASYRRVENLPQQAEENAPNVTVRKAVKLQPKQSAEIEIPVSDASGAGVTFMASPAVSATLLDASGAILGKNEAGTDESREMFRGIFVPKAAASGVWKLKLENTGGEETTALVAGWTSDDSDSFALSAGKPSPTGQVVLQAKLAEKGAPVLNAKITAKIGEKEIVLLDDSAHNDGAAGDGVYGATTEKLAKGEYFVEAKAEANGKTRVAVAAVQIGITGKAAAPTKKTAPKR
jgi:pimeloyl-ACP methyl ester carboxylesterase